MTQNEPDEVLLKMLAQAGPKLAQIRLWIDALRNQVAERARPVASYEFRLLPKYFPQQLLVTTMVVETDELPKIPFGEFGLAEFADFGDMPAAGITYGDTYFVVPESSGEESLHFHELIHVIQWRELGFDEFLLAYGVGLLTAGYTGSPLEAQAFRHQRRFDFGGDPYDVVKEVQRELGQMTLRPWFK